MDSVMKGLRGQCPIPQNFGARTALSIVARCGNADEFLTTNGWSKPNTRRRDGSKTTEACRKHIGQTMRELSTSAADNVEQQLLNVQVNCTDNECDRRRRTDDYVCVHHSADYTSRWTIPPSDGTSSGQQVSQSAVVAQRRTSKCSKPLVAKAERSIIHRRRCQPGTELQNCRTAVGSSDDPPNLYHDHLEGITHLKVPRSSVEVDPANPRSALLTVNG